MQKTIEFYKKEVYGKTLYYILDDKIAGNIRCLTRKTTVDESDLLALRDLGFQIIERISPSKVNFQWATNG
jgi:hypothetical protein